MPLLEYFATTIATVDSNHYSDSCHNYSHCHEQIVSATLGHYGKIFLDSRIFLTLIPRSSIVPELVRDLEKDMSEGTHASYKYI